MPHGFPQLRRTRERGIHAARKSKLSENLITGDVADVVLHTATVTRRDVPSLPHYACGTPERIAEKQTQQVEQMRTQHHHVLAASARVLFAEGPQFLHVPDQPFRDGLLEQRDHRHHAHRVSHGNPAPALVGFEEQLV